MLRAQLRSHLNLTPWPRAIGVAPQGSVMSQFSKMRHSRDQWKEQSKQRGKGERYERREKARMKAERDRLTHALKASEARVHALEAQLNGLATRPKADVVYLALQLFLEARISFRAVSRVLALLAWALGIQKAPCPQTILHWVIRLTIVRIDAARTVRGLPLEQAPFTNGLIWMIDLSIGLGAGLGQAQAHAPGVLGASHRANQGPFHACAPLGHLGRPHPEAVAIGWCQARLDGRQTPRRPR